MNKRDIRLESASRAKELRSWVEPLSHASPALADAFAKTADEIEMKGQQGLYDSFGGVKMMGRVIGMVYVAQVLLDEWKAHR